MLGLLDFESLALNFVLLILLLEKGPIFDLFCLSHIHTYTQGLAQTLTYNTHTELSKGVIQASMGCEAVRRAWACQPVSSLAFPPLPTRQADRTSQLSLTQSCSLSPPLPSCHRGAKSSESPES